MKLLTLKILRKLRDDSLNEYARICDELKQAAMHGKDGTYCKIESNIALNKLQEGHINFYWNPAKQAYWIYWG